MRELSSVSGGAFSVPTATKAARTRAPPKCTCRVARAWTHALVIWCGFAQWSMGLTMIRYSPGH